MQAKRWKIGDKFKILRVNGGEKEEVRWQKSSLDA